MSDKSACGADWFTASTIANRSREARRRAHPMSSAWGRKWLQEAAPAALGQLRDAVRNIVRVHGVPTTCRVELASAGQCGTASAGFEDSPASFNRPFILLDKRARERCEPAEVRDVYCGLGLHEAGHILHTREWYRRAHGPMSRFRRCNENLWEDERVEELVRRDSPGFGSYLQAAKSALLERGLAGSSLNHWHDLPDLDKVNLIIFAFIRLPHLVDDQMKRWRAINGECVFDTLRALFPIGPTDEADVERFATLCESLWDRLSAIYPGMLARASWEQVGRTQGVDVDSPEVNARIERQLVADALDRASHSSSSAGAGTADVGATSLVERLVDEAARLAADGWDRASQSVLDLAIEVEEGGNRIEGRDGRRFGLNDLEQVLNQVSSITRPLTDDEAAAVKRWESEPRVGSDRWDWDTERETIIEIPRPEPEHQLAYAAARRQVAGHIAAMKALFGTPFGQRIRHERERSEGRLDQRRLGRGVTTARIFRTTRVQAGGRLAVCLLIDESGSMARGTPTRAEAALQAAVLLVDALGGLPGVEIEVYSHTSCNQFERDCLVRYLYGRKNRHPAAIGSYAPREANYDHQAIKTAARLFVEYTTHPRRLMIVISDGYPSGVGYEGEPAIEATRASVTAVRRQGIRIMNIAIDDFRSEDIFGTANVVKYVDLGRLASDLRNLMVRIMRGAFQNG